MVNYAKGVPLVVKVLARFLRGKIKEVWESEIDKLEKMPLPEVYDVMKLSFDDLDRKEQQIFLDLACFFLQSYTKVEKGYVKSILGDSESDNSVVVGLERLKDKALITFSENDYVSMHDSLKEMACEIVRRESVKDPGSCSWLWDPRDIYEALTNDKGIGAIRSIVLHSPLPTVKKPKLSPLIFSKMSKLRFLQIIMEDDDDCYDFKPCWPKWQFWHKELKFLLSELRFLRWYNYPLKSLPENFSGEELVVLILQGKMKKLWDGVKNLVNLKKLDLSFSVKLKELPDLSKATNLKVLLLSECSKLTSVHPSIFSLTKLEILDLSGCCSLTTLASDFHLCNLSYLNLHDCTNLRKFSLISENMRELMLSFTDIKVLPSSFGLQSKLRSLHLSYCSKLQTLREFPLSLETLYVSDCESLKTLPELPLSLETLYVYDCRSLKTVLFPSIFEQLKENRKLVIFWNCWNLDEQSLVAIGLNAQINVMKFANQYLSRPNQDRVEDYVDYDDNYSSYQVVCVYRGSSVPEWLEYKMTRKKYVIIDLSSSPPSPLLGFIFCFVIGHSYSKEIYIGKLEVIISVSEDEGEKDSVTMYVDGIPFLKEGSYNVCVMYDQRCSAFLSSRAINQTKFKIEFTVNAPLNGIGVSSVYSHNSFVQEMELRD